MIQKLQAQGVKEETALDWDDGSDHDDVTKIYVRSSQYKNISYVYFDYVKNGKPKEGVLHGSLGYGCTQMFEINHLKDEYLESVEVYYNQDDGIQALQFKTNFKTSELMGYIQNSKKFVLAVSGKKIIGFHGTSETLKLNSLGAYFTWITPNRLEAKGGKGGKEWDDGYLNGDLTKIHLHGGSEGIQFIRFSYVKNGQVKDGPTHGFDGEGFTQTFEIDQNNNEYLVSIEGYVASSGIIQGLQFETNINKYKLMGYKKGRKFIVAADGKKIVGFHGYAEKSLHSLGAYFIAVNPCKLECQGRPTGYLWDDGSSYDGIRKVLVYLNPNDSISYIRFVYENNGKVEKVHRRGNLEDTKEFVLDYPNEYITSVELSLKKWLSSQYISALTIRTSKNRISPTFGTQEPGNTKVVLEKKGNVLVGFYGWSNNVTLNALGAYYRPPPSDPNKLEAKGGNGGLYWDDGSNFDGVGKIFLGLSENAVIFVKFLYHKHGRMVYGDDHGHKKNIFRTEEFELNFPAEHLISVEGTYDDIANAITMLSFKTNNGRSLAFGLDTTSNFSLHKDDHMIVGFHGKSDNMLLHQIGVHLIPI